MRGTWILAATMLLPAGVRAQNVLPEGTILPVSLDKDLNAHRLHLGQEIRATIMQSIPGTPVRRGAGVVGHVTSVMFAKNAPARIGISFDSILVRNRRLPIRTNLRALASPAYVEDAQDAMYGPDAGVGTQVESTNQIGGDLVFHGGGSVYAVSSSTEIGKSTQYGVLVPRRQSTLIGGGLQPYLFKDLRYL